MEKIFGKRGQGVVQNILSAKSTSERIRLIEMFLFDRLTSAATIDYAVKSTVDIILAAKGQLSVNELAKQNKTNRRQLVHRLWQQQAPI